MLCVCNAQCMDYLSKVILCDKSDNMPVTSLLVENRFCITSIEFSIMSLGPCNLTNLSQAYVKKIELHLTTNLDVGAQYLNFKMRCILISHNSLLFFKLDFASLCHYKGIRQNSPQ